METCIAHRRVESRRGVSTMNCRRQDEGPWLSGWREEFTRWTWRELDPTNLRGSGGETELMFFFPSLYLNIIDVISQVEIFLLLLFCCKDSRKNLRMDASNACVVEAVLAWGAIETSGVATDGTRKFQTTPLLLLPTPPSPTAFDTNAHTENIFVDDCHSLGQE